MDRKVCTKCGVEFPIKSHFVTVSNRKRTVRCLICRRRDTARTGKQTVRYAHYLDRKIAIAADVGGCVICKEKCTDILDFDHLDRSKKRFLISQWYRLSKYDEQDLEDEITNTRILCAYHHRIHTQHQWDARSDLPNMSAHAMYKKNFTKMKKDKLHNIKMEIGKCAICEKRVDEKECCAFDFDHLDIYEKHQPISRMYYGYKWERVLSEIQKCRLLCCNCHRKETLKQRKTRRELNWVPPQKRCIRPKLHQTVEDRKGSRPTKDELQKLVQIYTFVHVGKMYGVSDNAVRKWCKKYGLSSRRMDISPYVK